ncbi:MAG: MGH1-like glycoside hydrolase domain-containing protein [Cellulomonas sp.]
MTNDAAHRAEADRLGSVPRGSAHPAAPGTPPPATWATWGPYVAERAWGTVREDYSADGTSWEFFPHEHARSRAYRWNEDGMAAVCDDRQLLCLGLALWNGRDPILKERMFGLTGNEGNHGEDVKEYWWYLDSTPTHSWMRWRYHYPQAEYPYAQLVQENRSRDRHDPEFELLDTGVFDQDRYWRVEVTYAKNAPDDILMVITVENRGPDRAVISVLPTLWFRNTWAWGRSTGPVPTLELVEPGVVRAQHEDLGPMFLACDPAATALFCDNETNNERLFGAPGASRFPKDGINDFLLHGAATVNPDPVGTKTAIRHEVSLGPGQRHEIRLRLTGGAPRGLGEDFTATLAAREREADEFYAGLTGPAYTPEEAQVVRQSSAGLLWGKQFYHFDVNEWLDGDPAGPPPPAARRSGRNSSWRHLSAHDIFSMPDAWEYPWFAAWDLAFHAVPLAHLDPGFAKAQILVLLGDRYLHPGGQLPAYEWAFGDVNPPVHAWAALRVFHCAGDQDYDFLERTFHRLLINFTWWVNRKDSRGDNVFEGGFLGLDNIGPIDRSAPLPIVGRLEQSDATAWMAMYCLDMLEVALVLAEHDESYESMATKFVEHFAYIATAATKQSLWDEADGLFYDVISTPDGQRRPLRVRSLVGLLPMIATTTLGTATLGRLPGFAADLDWFLGHRPEYAAALSFSHVRAGATGQLLSMVPPENLRRLLSVLFDENEFLSPFGIRSLSKAHENHPYVLELPGFRAAVGYEPGESQSGVFGGNSNWRGPVWLPTNVMLIGGLRRFARLFGDEFTVEFPTGSGRLMTLREVAAELTKRLTAVLLPDARGRRPALGDAPALRDDPAWRQDLLFYEYFHAETGKGLGASHQTGWTALIADLLLHRDDSIDEP